MGAALFVYLQFRDLKLRRMRGWRGDDDLNVSRESERVSRPVHNCNKREDKFCTQTVTF